MGDLGGAELDARGGRVRGERVLKDVHELVRLEAKDMDARLDWRKLQGRN